MLNLLTSSRPWRALLVLLLDQTSLYVAPPSASTSSPHSEQLLHVGQCRAAVEMFSRNMVEPPSSSLRELQLESSQNREQLDSSWAQWERGSVVHSGGTGDSRNGEQLGNSRTAVEHSQNRAQSYTVGGQGTVRQPCVKNNQSGKHE